MNTTILIIFALVRFYFAIVGFLELIEELMATYKRKLV